MSERFGIELRPPERFVDEVGHAFLRANFPDRAVNLLKFNVEAHPTSFNAHQSLAHAYVAKGDVSLAIEHYEKALQLDPNRDDVKTRVGELSHVPPRGKPRAARKRRRCRPLRSR